MKKIVLLSSLVLLFSRCHELPEACYGPDRIVFKEAKAAFLESGFVLLEMSQDSLWAKSAPYWNCQPCSKVDLSHYKTQKDSGPITPNYRISCGIKYADQGVYYNNAPALRITIYSVKPI